MRFKWPCPLHSLVCSQWLPEDVVAEMWTNDSESLSVYRECFLLYSEFMEFATKLAEHLRPLSPTLVGIIWSPSIYTLVAVYGILLSSSSFMPISDYNRQAGLRELFGAVVCFTTNTDFLDNDFTCAQASPFRVYIRTDVNSQRFPPSDLAYCIMTSGSTGVPKLVLASHSCVTANVIELSSRLPPATLTSGVFITAPLTFDACIVQLFLALTTHRTVIFPSASILFSMDGELLAKVLIYATVDTWQCTPSIFSRLPPTVTNNKRMWIFLGGEPCSPTRVPKRLKDWKFLFLYGLTEVSAWSSIVEADILASEDPPIVGATPLGSPMAYSQVTLKDVDEETGIGEVYVARCGGGYGAIEEPFSSIKLLSALQRMSEAAFVATGDFAVASQTSQSPLWFLGRKDRLVKVYGKKCHLECLETEIVRLLDNHLEATSYRVLNCRCQAHPLGARIQLDKTPSVEEINNIKQWLLQRISFPMTPCNIILSNSPLILNANGKVVDKSLQLTCFSSIGSADMKCLHQLTFQQLGGSSLRAMHLIESLIIDWPALKSKKAVLLTTLFSRPFSEFIQVAQKESTLVDTEDDGGVVAPVPEKQQKLETEYEATLVWSVVLGKCVDASPVVDTAMENVFIGSHAGVFKRLCIKTGEVLWSRAVGSRIEATACLMEDLVVFGTLDGEVHALKVSDGTTAWTVNTRGAVKSAPTKVPNSPWILVGSHGRTVFAIEAGGRTVWTVKPDRSPIAASITVDSNSEFAFVGTLGGGIHRININFGNCDWSVGELGPIFGAPTLLSDLGRVVVTTADGSVHCISESRGERLWTVTVTPRGGFFAPAVPLSIRQHRNSPILLLANQSGRLHAVAPSDGSVVWNVDCSAVGRTASARTAFLTKPCLTTRWKRQQTPLVVFTRTDGCLFVCDGGVETSPVPSLVYQLPSETFSTPLALHLQPDILSIFVGCRNDTVNRIDLVFNDILNIRRNGPYSPA